ncbi:LamG-like jellyroll fold domain-containing protein [Herbihabitans rhizosphaerae]|nr:LamG-like jellyroll fold domain-containing protein [Herbihabitans rhizosphaerae]
MRQRQAGLLAAVALLASGASVVLTALPAAAQDARAIGTVSMGENSRLSAAVYDERGQLVRHLYDLAPRAGKVNLTWDGKDDWGHDLPHGKYNWRAISTGAVGAPDGQAGDMGKPVPGAAYERSENPGNATAVTYGPDGDLYIQSNGEEFQHDVRRYKPKNLGTGEEVWTGPHGYDGWRDRGHAIAVDQEYVYAASIGRTGKVETHYTVQRRRADTGQHAPWGTAGGEIRLADNWTGLTPVTGIAVDGKYLWVSDTAGKRIRVFDKATGSETPVGLSLDAAPRGIVTDGNGHVWAAVGDHVRHYVHDGGTVREVGRSTALGRPYGLALHRSALYVSDLAAGTVRGFDVSGTAPVERPVPWRLSNMRGPGLVTDTTFGWKFDTGSMVDGGDAAIAVSPDGGTLSVVDHHNGRVMFYDTTTGAPRAERLQSVNGPTPDVDVTVGQDLLFSQNRQYEVNHLVTDQSYGRPWRLRANWSPVDDLGNHTVDSSVIRTLNGQRYLYAFAAQRCGAGNLTDPNSPPSNCLGQPGSFPFGGVLVYRLHPDEQGMTRVAQLRRLGPSGGPRSDSEVFPRMTLTTDTNGNGALDPGDLTEQTSHKGYLNGNPSMWVDDKGTIWFANATTVEPGKPAVPGVARLQAHLPLLGSPRYRLEDFHIQQGTQSDLDPGTGRATNSGAQVVHDTKKNRLFTTVDTTEFNQFANGGGNAVAMLDVRTGQRSVFSGYSRFEGPRYQHRDSPTGIAVDSSGGYFYTGGNSGEGQRISMHTWDGLPVARATSQLPAVSAGLLDRGMSLTAFTHWAGTHFAYAQDDGYGTNQRYAFTGVHTVHRSGSDPETGSTSGQFEMNWSHPTGNDLVAHWRMDGARSNTQTVIDSTTGNHWGTYDSGHNARWRPAGGVRDGALFFERANKDIVTLGKRASSPAGADNLFDDSTYPGMSVATWFNTTSSGVLVSYQDAVSRPTSQPSQSVPLAYVGEDGKLYGGALTAPGCTTPRMASPDTVNDGTWHHVAVVAERDQQVMYLDGREVGRIACGRFTEDLQFSLLGAGYTKAGTWPSTPNTDGYFHLDGGLDDTRLYRRALSAEDVGYLATPPKPSGPLAHWTFDEQHGEFAADVSDHGKEAAVVKGTWRPHPDRPGGALEFNGTSTRATVPRTIGTLSPQTVAVWVKPAAPGPVFGDQRGAYPSTMVDHWASAGYGSMSNTAIRVAADGTVHSAFGLLDLASQPGGPNLLDGGWHHVAVVTDRQPEPCTEPQGCQRWSGTLYLDGRPVASRVADGLNAGWQTTLRPDNQFGAARDDAGEWSFFTGLLDDAMIYDRVLTAGEVAALAAARP